MRLKPTGGKGGCSLRESGDHDSQVKQCLFLLLMENQESNPTKKSDQPGWVILGGSVHLAGTAADLLPEGRVGRSLPLREEAPESLVLLSLPGLSPVSSRLLETTDGIAHSQALTPGAPYY